MCRNAEEMFKYFVKKMTIVKVDFMKPFNVVEFDFVLLHDFFSITIVALEYSRF